MNIQAMMKQAQKLQKDMLKAKEEVECKKFTYKKGFIEVEANGKKEILKISIHREDNIEKEEIEMIEDLILLAVNEVFSQIDKEMEEKMGKFGPGMAGLF